MFFYFKDTYEICLAGTLPIDNDNPKTDMIISKKKDFLLASRDIITIKHKINANFVRNRTIMF